MKNRMLRSLSLLCIPVMMALSVSAQQPSKLKAKDKDNKYRTEDLKIKDKEKGGKYTDYKVTEKDKGKVKGIVHPMNRTMYERTDLKSGETQVRTKQHIERVEEPLPEVTPATPIVATEVSVNPMPLPEKKVAVHKRVAPKTMHKSVAVRRPAVKYVTRTKLVRDTVFVPSDPIVRTNTEYIHDTVELTRVDTFTKVQTQNTYTGYRVPRGNFKKVTLKKDKNTGEVYMKRKGKSE
jgi:hypothetical protein